MAFSPLPVGLGAVFLREAGSRTWRRCWRQVVPKRNLTALDTNVVVMQISDAARESSRTGKTVRQSRLGKGNVYLQVYV